MSVALTLIVRDGEATLARCLASVATVVDEMIVVDTGSQDASLDIARSAGAHVFHYHWQDDFAAARNDALSKTCCDWALVLDADQYLLPEGQQALPEILSHLPKGPVAVWGAVHEIGKPTLALRALVRLNEGLQFWGRVHETVTQSNGEAPHWIECHQLAIAHEPVRTQTQKDVYYLYLIEQEESTHPPLWRRRELAYHRGEIFWRSGQLAQAAQALKEAWNYSECLDDFAIHLQVKRLHVAWQSQDLGLAQTLAHELLQSADYRPEGWFYQAYSDFWYGHLSAVEPLLCEAEKRGAPRAECQLLQARVWLLSGRTEAARVQLFSLAQSTPTTSVGIHLARAYALTGDPTTAQALYARVRSGIMMPDAAWSPLEQSQWLQTPTAWGSSS